MGSAIDHKDASIEGLAQAKPVPARGEVLRRIPVSGFLVFEAPGQAVILHARVVSQDSRAEDFRMSMTFAGDPPRTLTETSCADDPETLRP